MRKAGKKHSKLTLLPPGFRRDIKYELPVRAALFALSNNQLKEEHLIDLYTLAELARLSGCKGHFKTHSESLARLATEIGNNGLESVKEGQIVGIIASANILLDYVAKLSNANVANAALKGYKSIR